MLRVPIVPGCDPTKAYGNLYDRGVRGIVLEAFGVEMPGAGSRRRDGSVVAFAARTRDGGVSHQSVRVGDLHPELYATGSLAMEMGAEAGPMMTPECVVKLMLCLAYPNLPITLPLAGEL